MWKRHKELKKEHISICFIMLWPLQGHSHFIAVFHCSTLMYFIYIFIQRFTCSSFVYTFPSIELLSSGLFFTFCKVLFVLFIIINMTCRFSLAPLWVTTKQHIKDITFIQITCCVDAIPLFVMIRGGVITQKVIITHITQDTFLKRVKMQYIT